MAGPGSGFLKRAVIADSTAHRPVPTPFREGTCFDSAGFATPRRPWLRDIPTVPEPCRGSLHAAMAKIDRNSFPPNKPGRGQTRFPPASKSRQSKFVLAWGLLPQRDRRRLRAATNATPAIPSRVAVAGSGIPTALISQ